LSRSAETNSCSTRGPSTPPSFVSNSAAGIKSEWGTSGNNRKAKFYSITKAGRRQLAADARHWERLTGVMDRVFGRSKDGDDEDAINPEENPA